MLWGLWDDPIISIAWEFVQNAVSDPHPDLLNQKVHFSKMLQGFEHML
jgi:hypothetical protein